MASSYCKYYRFASHHVSGNEIANACILDSVVSDYIKGTYYPCNLK